MARQTFRAGERIKQGQEVWFLSGLRGVYLKPKSQIKGDKAIGTALEDAEPDGLVVVEVANAEGGE